LLIDPRTATVSFANRAAHRLAGGTFPSGEQRDVYTRVAAGEAVSSTPFALATPQGPRMLLASGGRFDPPGVAAPVAVLTLDERAEPGSPRDERERLGRELEAILAGVADAVLAQAPDGSLIYVNDAAVRLLGVPAGFPDRDSLLAADPADLAARLEVLDEHGRPYPARRMPGRRALRGEDPEPVTLRYRVRATGASRWMRVKAQGVRDAGGRVTRAINVVEDITDLKQVESTLRLLADASRMLAGSLDYMETLRRVAQLAVPSLADWCMVDVLGERGLQRMAVAHADPAVADLAEELRGIVIDPLGTEGPAAVVRTGFSELHPYVDAAHVRRAARDPRHHELLSRLGVRSAAIVPLTVRGRQLGVLTLSTTTSGRVLGAEQLTVLEELGRRAAAAIDSAQQYRQRSAIARTLQNSLLPPLLPEIPGLEAAAVYRPAGDGTDVGGDFYDLFTVADDEWIAVIGDVCGKGAEAAAVTALARYTIRTAAVRRRSPAAILRWLNDAMLRQDSDGRFCTIACVHIDTSRPRIRLSAACGGHPPALLRRADGTVADLGGAGTLLGLVPDLELEDDQAEIGRGDTLLLYTDGVTEARAPQHTLEPEELHAVVARLPDGSAQAQADALVAAALGPDPGPPRDDIAVLALRARG
jgi:serine phosphatase RsbU (regulator of sigma subunit)/PAS domain-containing protein